MYILRYEFTLKNSESWKQGIIVIYRNPISYVLLSFTCLLEDVTECIHVYNKCVKIFKNQCICFIYRTVTLTSGSSTIKHELALDIQTLHSCVKSIRSDLKWVRYRELLKFYRYSYLDLTPKRDIFVIFKLQNFIKIWQLFSYL